MASPRPHHPGARLRRHAIGALVGAAIILSSCGIGPRPSFEVDEPRVEATGDAAIDAVLNRLDGVGISQFTADYTILTRLGGAESTATVVQANDSRRSVTVNDIRFLDGSGNAATCDLATAECEAIINDARISDVQLTHDFYAMSMARRLRVDAARSLSSARGFVETIAGEPATCAEVAVSGGAKTYCALDTGVVARYDGADLLVELTAYSDVPDESRFTSG